MAGKGTLASSETSSFSQTGGTSVKKTGAGAKVTSSNVAGLGPVNLGKNSLAAPTAPITLSPVITLNSPNAAGNASQTVTTPQEVAAGVDDQSKLFTKSRLIVGAVVLGLLVWWFWSRK